MYVIAIGDRGIYDTWDQVKKKKKLMYKKVSSLEEAELILAKILPDDYDESDFISPILDIYTDGSYDEGRAGYGIVFGHEELSVKMAKGTHNDAEQEAILEAIRLTKEIGGTKIIHTDSCVSIYRHYDTENYYFHYIKAHTNLLDRHSIGNKKADRLAGEATKSNDLDRVLTFGIHKGKKYSEVNKAYLEWCVKNLKYAEPIKEYLANIPVSTI